MRAKSSLPIRLSIAIPALCAGLHAPLAACTSFAVYAAETWYGMNFDYPPTEIRLFITHEGDRVVYHAGMPNWGRIAQMNDLGLFSNLQILDFNTPQTSTAAANGLALQALYDEPIRSLGTVGAVLDYINGRRVVPSWTTSLHTLFADRDGRAMVVEPYGSSSAITENPGPFLVMTNFPNHDFAGQDYRTTFGTGADRYQIAYAYIQGHLAGFSRADALETLRRTVQSSGSYPTLVSQVFDPDNLEVFACFARDFTRIWRVSLRNETIETYAGFPLNRVLPLDAAGLTASTLALPFSAADATLPVLRIQPAGSTSAAGGRVVLTTVATGIGLAYQWRKDGVAIGGATGPSLVLDPIAAGDAGVYTVVVSNPAGSVVSSAAVLAVDPVPAAPAFTAQPQSQTVQPGFAAVFPVAVSGNPAPALRWQRLSAGAADWTDLTQGGSYRGVASAALTVRTVTPAMSGDQFRCVASNSLGSATSAAATLTVPAPAGDLLQYPIGLVRDAAGNLIVADAGANVVRRITPAGVVTLIAGTVNVSGSLDGTGAAATFNSPSGLASDAAGNLLVADTANATIRRVSPQGAVTTLAGSASSRGSQDGAGATARFNQPGGVAVDAAGNAFVADTFNSTIRRIAADGTVTTLAGSPGQAGFADGNGAAARFHHPRGLALAAGGNLVVADTGNSTVRLVSSAGAVSTVAGTAGVGGSDDGPAADALFNQPTALAVDGAGNLFIADTGNNTIRRLSAAGAVTTVAGVGGIAGLSNSAEGLVLLNQPQGIAADAAGNLTVADTGNAALRRIAADGTVTSLALSAATTSPPTTTIPGSPDTQPANSGGGGGGGALDPRTLALLALLSLARFLARWPGRCRRD